MLSPRLTAPVMHPPEGVSLSGLRGDPTAGPFTDSLFFIVTVGRDVTITVLSSWLYERIKDHCAKLIRINGREPNDRADFDRIVREEIEIGKND